MEKYGMGSVSYCDRHLISMPCWFVCSRVPPAKSYVQCSWNPFGSKACQRSNFKTM